MTVILNVMNNSCSLDKSKVKFNNRYKNQYKILKNLMINK